MSENATLDEAPPDVSPESPPEEATKVKPTPEDTKPKRLPPYAVVVLNDEEHTFPYVIEVLQRICGHKLEQAWELTNGIHLEGRAIVWTGSKEVAELKRDQIRGFGPDFYAEMTVRYPLGVMLEPMPGD